MANLLIWGGRVVGGLGAVLCVVAVICRLLGNYHLMGFEVGSLLLAGTSAAVIGCFLLLLAQSSSR